MRSCKYHLRRIVGKARLTYEELSTVLTQIEAVLNSRPISPLSTDPNDLSPLTPAHFLIGRPLLTPASEDMTAKTTLLLTRYHRIEQLRQHFWKRGLKSTWWSCRRGPSGGPIKATSVLDTLVVIKEDNQAPMKWKLGRVVKLFPGSDGISRVADLKTATGIIRRSFAKICPLPSQTDNLSD